MVSSNRSKNNKNTPALHKPTQLQIPQPTFNSSKPISATEYYQQAVQAYHAKQWQEAYRIAQICIKVTLDPMLAIDAKSICAAAMLKMSQPEQALALWQEIDEVLPNNVGNLPNIGAILIKLQRYSEAIGYLQRIAKLLPSHDAYLNLGFACYHCGDTAQAKHSYLQALAFDPKSIQARFNLAETFQDEALFAEAYQIYEQVLKIDPKNINALGVMVFSQQYRYPLDLNRQIESLQRYRQLFEQADFQLDQHSTKPQPHTPLRIGFVSADLRQHTVSYFLESTLEQLKLNSELSNKLTLIAYHNHHIIDQYTDRLRTRFDLWHQVNEWSDVRLIEQIRRDAIDILIDLSGHTIGNRLPIFASKVAPLQVSWLGYWGSTGLTTMDYVLADPISVPQNEEQGFTEKIWRLPSLRYCLSIPDDAPDVTPLPSAYHQQFVFGCYQAVRKINHEVLVCWSRILTSCPHARLRIQSVDFERSGLKDQLLMRLQSAELDIQRIDLVGVMTRQQYLTSYAEVDILLDTFPFPGGTTTAEALWMGVPTITLALPSMLGRQGEALMINAGLSDWVAYSEEEYVQKAIGWANTGTEKRQKLAALRAGLREQVSQSPVFNAKQFAHDFVDAMYGMWQEKCDTSSNQLTSPPISIPKSPFMAASIPDNAVTYYQQAVQAFHTHRWQQVCHFAQSCIATARENTLRIDAKNIYAAALMRMFQPEQALTLWMEVAKELPNDVGTLINIGLTLTELGRHDESIQFSQRAIEISPLNVGAHLNLGLAFARNGNTTQAKHSYRQAVRYDPSSAQAKYSLAVVLYSEGSFDEAHQMYEQMLEVDFSNVYALDVNTLSLIVLLQNYRYPLDINRQMKDLRRYSQRFEHLESIKPIILQPQASLRVGIVSADLWYHPVGFFLDSTLEQLRIDSKLSSKLKLIAYHNNSKEDVYTNRLQKRFDQWHQVSQWNDERLIEQIKQDRIDILIDLSGHTVGNRLPIFALKPAPLQLSWLGYWGSTGLTSIDYVLADSICVPMGEEPGFIEKIWRLPSLRYCLSIPPYSPEVSPLPCIERQEFVFGCYQAASKINQDVLQCWSRILAASPHARLRIQVHELIKTEELREQFIARLDSVGIEIQRIDFADAMPHKEYLSSYANVDMVLDTFPFPGGTTTAEALWMGVPTITLALPTMLGRQGEALMLNAGLSDWVAYNEEEYVQKAIGWANADATQRQKLASLRAGMRKQVRESPVFNAKQFAHDFVEALYGMWEEKCDASSHKPTNSIPKSTEISSLIPDKAAVYYQKAVEAYHSSQWQEVCHFAQSCLAIAQDHAMHLDAKSICAAALVKMSQPEQALALWQEIDRELPDNVNNLVNIGTTLMQCRRYFEAIGYLERAIKFVPGENLYINVGFSYYHCGEITKANESYLQALTYNPQSIQARHNLAELFQDETLFEEAQQVYEQVLEIDSNKLKTLSVILSLQHYRYPLSTDNQIKSLRRYEQQFKQADLLTHSEKIKLQSHTPLRIGFVSADLRQHPVGYFLESTLDQLRSDPTLSNRLELIAYHNHIVTDSYTERLRPCFNLWHQVNEWSDDRLAEQIKQDQIDLLIDLSGHTVGHRLEVFALRPAPLQISWLGYHGSTGVPNIDYVLADPITVPANEEQGFTEKVWRLPNLRYCLSIPSNAPDVSLPPCLNHQYVVFGCYQPVRKINQGVLHCWSRILEKCPHARLRIQLRDSVKAEAKDRFVARLNHAGIDMQRVELVTAMTYQDYLASYAEVDVLLDTFPFPGGTTTAEALWMGVPTITLALPSMLGRQGEALMVNAGLSDWVTYSEAEYVQKAVAWANADATQRQKLATLRASMREQVRYSPVFNAKQFAHDFVDALYGMWQTNVDTQ